MPRRAVGCALFCGAMLAYAQPAPPPVPELKLSVAVGPAFPLGTAGERWAQLLTERAQGAWAARMYPGATLAQRDAAQELRALQAGTIDLAVGSALAWSDAAPSLAVVALPWLAPTDASLAAVIADPDVQQRLAEGLSAQGIVLVALAPLGHRALATSSRAVRAPADLAGLRVRTPTTQLIRDTYAALGAKPGVLAFAEAQAAFAAGTLDGQDAPATALAAARVWGNGLKQATQWGAFGDAIVFAVRREVWAAWPETLQVAARETAAAAVREAMVATREDAAFAELAKNGVALTRLTPAGHAVFGAASRAVYDQWTPAIGAALVAAAQAASRRASDPASTAPVTAPAAGDAAPAAAATPAQPPPAPPR